MPDRTHAPLEVFGDCWDDDTEDFVHVCYGVTSPAGGGIAQQLNGGGFFAFQGRRGVRFQARRRARVVLAQPIGPEVLRPGGASGRVSRAGGRSGPPGKHAIPG
ncbi:hypothetical protein GCM10009799_13170 [Nocardiopsis rhodophaea]|uniref:Uncharacterized protein n=1 Tax=Nocardiopsis rhodophaea TaxID=280238 RepID=A0ABP5E4T6_9ACTN